ncbi:MAG: hypothetical protein AB7O91_04145 [Sphingomonas sp.]
MYGLPQLVAVGVVSAIGSVGLWTFAGKLIELIWKREDSDNERLRREVAEAKAAHTSCEERVDALERRLEAVEHHHSSLIPRWIRNAAKRIIWINDAAMMQIFAPLRLSREQVEGHTFHDLLGPEAAREIDRLDRDALAWPGKAASTPLTLHSSLRLMIVVNIAGVGRDRELIFEGYAYCANLPEAALDRGIRRGDEQRGLSELRARALPPPIAAPPAGETD